MNLEQKLRFFLDEKAKNNNLNIRFPCDDSIIIEMSSENRLLYLYWLDTNITEFYIGFERDTYNLDGRVLVCINENYHDEILSYVGSLVDIFHVNEVRALRNPFFSMRLIFEYKSNNEWVSVFKANKFLSDKTAL